MDNNLITVAEYARIRGCSTAAVYKRLETTLKPYSKTVKGKTYLTRQVLIDEGLKTVENEGKQNQQGLKEVEETVINRPEQGETAAEAIASQAIKALEGQLIAKDQEITRLHQEIQELKEQLADAVKHNQEHTDKLTELLAQANELNRNNQILLAQASQEKEPKPAEQIPERVEPIPEPEKKKSWLYRFFIGE